MLITAFQVNPQFYAFRWITLLLMQEFKFHGYINLWDTLLGDPEGPQVRELPFLHFSLNMWGMGSQSFILRTALIGNWGHGLLDQCYHLQLDSCIVWTPSYA
jgi:hypothetical protein